MACIAARGTICCCVCSRDVFHPCSFGSAGILALASTSKLYAAGLKHEVRRAMAIVLWRLHMSELWHLYASKSPLWCDFGCTLWRDRLLILSDNDSDDDSMPELVDIAAVVTEHQSRVAVHTHGISLPLWWRHV